MDKAQLVEEIGRIQGQIAQDEMDLKTWEKIQAKIDRNKILGIVAMVLAVILVLVFGSSWLVIGVALFLVGIVVLIPAVTSQDKAKWLIEATQDRIVKSKQELAKLQARLVVD